MLQKFGRNYRLTIDPKDGGAPILITLPLTIEFAVKRDINSDLNPMTVNVYNLAEGTRRRIFQDRFNLGATFLNGIANGPRTIKLEAGYSTLYAIYEGEIFQANSARDGTDIITTIDCRGGKFDIASAQVYQTLQGTPSNPLTVGGILKFLIGQFPTLQLGALGSFSDTVQRPVVLNGNVYDLLKQYSGGQAFIDNGKVYVLSNAEALQTSGVALLNDATGLLGTPRRDDVFLTITTLLEAGIDLAQQVEIQSTVQPIYNGKYKVIGIQHQGTISGAVSGDCRSIFTLQAPGPFIENNTPAFIPVTPS